MQLLSGVVIICPLVLHQNHSPTKKIARYFKVFFSFVVSEFILFHLSNFALFKMLGIPIMSSNYQISYCFYLKKKIEFIFIYIILKLKITVPFVSINYLYIDELTINLSVASQPSLVISVIDFDQLPWIHNQFFLLIRIIKSIDTLIIIPNESI